MVKCFPKLTQNTVKIALGNGEELECSMLPVSDLGTLHEVSELLEKGDKTSFEKARDMLLELASKVLKDYSDNLKRFSVDMLASLVAYLMFGDDDTPQSGNNSKKNEA